MLYPGRLRYSAGSPSPSGCAVALVREAVALIRGAVAVVGDAVACVGDAVAFIGGPVAFIGEAVSFLGRGSGASHNARGPLLRSLIP
jgi:hypothetical protein